MQETLVSMRFFQTIAHNQARSHIVLSLNYSADDEKKRKLSISYQQKTLPEQRFFVTFYRAVKGFNNQITRLASA